MNLAIKIGSDTSAAGQLKDLALAYERSLINPEEVRNFCISSLYKLSAIGIKFSARESVSWSYKKGFEYEDIIIEDDFPVHIHPALWSYFGVNTRKQQLE